ncbi:hypothetical protein [Pseudomonas savastanoi]|nr:hypothetical protein [Pseudomonas savastanoi]
MIRRSSTFFPTWLNGAELVVPDEDQRRDPLQLVSVLQQGITHAFLHRHC